MARTLEQERAAIAAEARKLEERQQRLEEREREQAIADIDTLRHQEEVLGSVASAPTVWRAPPPSRHWA